MECQQHVGRRQECPATSGARLSDGAARVGEGTALADSVPFEEWAAAYVATLIDARSL